MPPECPTPDGNACRDRPTLSSSCCSCTHRARRSPSAAHRCGRCCAAAAAADARCDRHWQPRCDRWGATRAGWSSPCHPAGMVRAHWSSVGGHLLGQWPNLLEQQVSVAGQSSCWPTLVQIQMQVSIETKTPRAFGSSHMAFVETAIGNTGPAVTTVASQRPFPPAACWTLALCCCAGLTHVLVHCAYLAAPHPHWHAPGEADALRHGPSAAHHEAAP